MQMFLATGGVHDPSVILDADEEVEVQVLEWDEFIELFKAQAFVQSMQTCTIMYALMRMKKMLIV